MAHRSPPSGRGLSEGDNARDHEKVQETLSDDDLARIEDQLIEDDLPAGPVRDDAESGQEHRRVDGLIVARLAADGFQGKRFEARYAKLVKDLAGYAYPVLIKLMSTGEIFRLCRRCGRPVPRQAEPVRWTLDDRRELASGTVLAGEKLFLTVGLRRGGWDPAGGRSLRTYFVNGCIRCFAEVYGKWWKEKQVSETTMLLSGLGTEETSPLARIHQRYAGHPPYVDPSAAAVLQDEVRRAIEPMTDAQLREVVGLRAIGYTQREAAQEAGLTEKAAERRLSTYRQNLRQRNAPAEPHDPEDPDGGGRRER